MDFETEEQQVEALKRWWKENGKQVIAGAVIGLALVGGWRYYLVYSDQQKTEASAIYDQLKNNSSTDADALLEKLRKSYSATNYLPAAELILAKRSYENGDKEKSLGLLDNVISASGNNEIALLARERKSRILLELEKYNEALNALDVENAGSFNAIFSEIKGDIYSAQNKIDEARQAYDSALMDNPSGRPVLQMKRDNIGMVTAESAQ